MKKINKFPFFIIGAIFFLSCSDLLDTAPEGSIITSEQKKEAIRKNPSLLLSDITALWSGMATYNLLGGAKHFDFGYASFCLMMECNGQDMTTVNINYNHYSVNCAYQDRVYSGTNTSFMWKLFYSQILSANSILALIPDSTDNAELRAFRGQALAARAFDYLNLVQLLQFTYKGHEQSPAVPLITEKTPLQEASNNPRATVEGVYKQILDDLNESIRLLKAYKRPDRGFIDTGVAYGLRARANLLMQNYGAAAEDAGNALLHSGAMPYSREEVSRPAFWNAGDSPVIWANIVSENNDIVISGIINMPSHLCSFYTNGYVGVGTWKKISKLLYGRIPATDVRKGWWLDERSSSPLVSGSRYEKWFRIASANTDFGPYTNVKFGIYRDDLKKLLPANDWFLMRAEEMILIQAEALAMDNQAGKAKALLENFVKMYRDPSYSCPASDADGIREEVWLQRRIELWGEGFSFYDLMRLKKPVIRVENGVSSFSDAYKFNIAAEAPILLWPIPQSEIQTNGGIGENDNNPATAPPRPE
jgi:hypothetical protein